jgi:hypothetical protein
MRASNSFFYSYSWLFLWFDDDDDDGQQPSLPLQQRSSDAAAAARTFPFSMIFYGSSRAQFNYHIIIRQTDMMAFRSFPFFIACIKYIIIFNCEWRWVWVNLCGYLNGSNFIKRLIIRCFKCDFILPALFWYTDTSDHISMDEIQ